MTIDKNINDSSNQTTVFCEMKLNKCGKLYCSNCGHIMDFYDCGCNLGEYKYRHPYCFECGAKVI